MNQIQNPKDPVELEPNYSESAKLKRFEVELGFTQYSSAKIIVEAASRAEAEAKVDEMQTGEIYWNLMDGDMTILHIAPLDENDSKPAKKE